MLESISYQAHIIPCKMIIVDSRYVVLEASAQICSSNNFDYLELLRRYICCRNNSIIMSYNSNIITYYLLHNFDFSTFLEKFVVSNQQKIYSKLTIFILFFLSKVRTNLEDFNSIHLKFTYTLILALRFCILAIYNTAEYMYYIGDSHVTIPK